MEVLQKKNGWRRVISRQGIQEASKKDGYLKIGQEAMKSSPDNTWTSFLLSFWHKMIKRQVRGQVTVGLVARRLHCDKCGSTWECGLTKYNWYNAAFVYKGSISGPGLALRIHRNSIHGNSHSNELHKNIIKEVMDEGREVGRIVKNTRWKCR